MSKNPDSGGTCAVIVAAYRATRWISEALESIREQQPRDGWTYTLRIGVDGCEETSALLSSGGQPHWYSPRNVGPYVVRNSLIALEPADAYAVFDADDVMRPDYLSTLLHFMGDGIAGAARQNIDHEGTVTSHRRAYQSGVAMFSRTAWERLGGYRAWHIAADHDLILRAKASGITLTRPSRPLYFRRIHPESLTQDPEAGFGTLVRWGYKDRAERLTKQGARYVEPVTTAMEYRA